jgi:FkbM family methyltransferase
MHAHLSARWAAFRYALKRVFAFIVVPIQGGPLKGCLWGAFCGIRYLRGDYDARYIVRLRELVAPGDTFYDVGAHVGYYAVVMSRHVGPKGRVVAFEPLPVNLRFLRRHLRLNRCENAHLVEAAVGEHAGRATFAAAKGSGRGALGGSGGTSVRVTRIDDVWADGGTEPPTLIKMDIEGGELSALRGAGRTLHEHRPVVMLAVHGEDLRRECTSCLQAQGYELIWYKPNSCIAVAAERLDQLRAVRRAWGTVAA